jgi:GT2 family glycosyltransferase
MSASSTPAASIVIVSYNSAGQLGGCLAALKRLQFAPAYEIIVVDNASRDGSRAIAAAEPGVRLLAMDENLGFAGGVNRGVAAARGPIVALLNPDALADRDWLQQIAAPLADAQIGVVGSKVLGADGRIQSLGAALGRPELLTSHLRAGEPDRAQDGALAEVWSVHGAAMAFRRELWERLGGFDEGFYPAYWEESDFCERARGVGYRVVVAPRAAVRHDHEASSTGKYGAEFYYYYHRNRLRYAAKWLGWPAIWYEFRPAERARLSGAPPLDRRVARVVYEQGVPELGAPSADERAAVLATGQALREGRLPDDSFAPLAEQIEQAAANAVHHEHAFRSRLPLVARLRTAWNNIATRWYVRPNLDQQTRFNLAAQRALAAIAEQASARAAADALDSALLAWRVRTLER